MPMITTRDLFDRLERFYDAVPRQFARAEEFGGLVLFVRDGPGWPYYARPRLVAPGSPTAAEIEAVRGRQRELGVPEAFEWTHDIHRDLLSTARSCGLAVLEAPLLVLDAEAIDADPSVRIADPNSASFATDVGAARAVASVAFAADGTARGEPGPAERDAAYSPPDADDVATSQRSARLGTRATAVLEDADAGVVACGTMQRDGDVAELVGIATLPSSRRVGFGARVTLALAAAARAAGAETVFLSAGSPAIARVYERVGFRHVGTACIAEPVDADTSGS